MRRVMTKTDPVTGARRSEWVTLPDTEQPIRPLVPTQPEVSLSLYGDPGANRDRERRRKVDHFLEQHSVRPPRSW